MATPKAVKSNFTPEQVAIIAASYDGNAPEEARRALVTKLATDFKMSSRQIIGKISTMPELTYVPYSKAAPKVKGATNMEICASIAAAIGSDIDSLASLSRGSKKAMNAVLDAVSVQSEQATDAE